jgi:hypothetical protein
MGSYLRVIFFALLGSYSFLKLCVMVLHVGGTNKLIFSDWRIFHQVRIFIRGQVYLNCSTKA